MRFPKKLIGIICLPVIFSILLFFVVSNTGFAQVQFLYDLKNLRDQDDFLTASYDAINAQSAWDVVNEADVDLSSVVIGIIDSGLDENHPEFAGEMIDSNIVGQVNLGSTPLSARSDSESESGGHGTQVAGIIGANNLLGLGVGVASDSPQMNGILSGFSGLDYTLEMRRFGVLARLDPVFDFFLKTRSIDKSGGQIINLSLGWTKSSALTEEQKETVDGQLGSLSFFKYTQSLKFVLGRYSDTLFVVAAGNENIDAENTTPANIERDNVITVAATLLGDERTDFSNFGSVVDLSTPGAVVYAPAALGKGEFPEAGGDYTLFGGTSASAPMVTGVAGLLKAIDPSLTPAQIKQILTETADPIDTATPEERDNNELGKLLGIDCFPIFQILDFRGCRLNALRAVQAVLPPTEPCILSGTLSTDTTLTASQSPCVIQGSLTIPSGKTLTIDPGVVIKFAFTSSKIEVNGTLNANGTASKPIFFTSIKDDTVGGDTNNDGASTSPAARDWKEIFIPVTTGSATFSHTTIRYGGGSFSFPRAGIHMRRGTLSLTDSHLTQNGKINLVVFDGSTATILSSELDTADIGISLNGGSVTVSQSSIHDHTGFGVSASLPMDALNNWWGSSTGPFHATLNPSGLGNAVSDNVDFIPFLTTDPVGSLP